MRKTEQHYYLCSTPAAFEKPQKQIVLLVPVQITFQCESIIIANEMLLPCLYRYQRDLDGRGVSNQSTTTLHVTVFIYIPKLRSRTVMKHINRVE